MTPADPASIDSTPGAAPAPAAPSARPVIAGQMAVLTRLAEIGMELAEACGREARQMAAEHAAEAAAGAGEGALAATPAGPRRDPGLAFARVARAVRMTIALQSRLLKDLEELDRIERNAQRMRAGDRRTRLCRQLDRAVEAAAEARRGGDGPLDDEAVEAEVERLSSEAYERLTDAEDLGLAGADFAAALAGICRDLGLAPDWAARLMAAAEVEPAPGAEAPAPVADAPGPPERLQPAGACRPPPPDAPPLRWDGCNERPAWAPAPDD